MPQALGFRLGSTHLEVSRGPGDVSPESQRLCVVIRASDCCVCCPGRCPVWCGVAWRGVVCCGDGPSWGLQPRLRSEDGLGQPRDTLLPCCVSSANGRPGGFCVSEKDCGDGSDEKTCPEPAGQCIEAHAPSPQNPRWPQLPQSPRLPGPELPHVHTHARAHTHTQKQQRQAWKSQGRGGREDTRARRWGGGGQEKPIQSQGSGRGSTLPRTGQPQSPQSCQWERKSLQGSGGRMFTQTPASEFPNLSYRRTPRSQQPGPGSTSRLRPCQPARSHRGLPSSPRPEEPLST